MRQVLLQPLEIVELDPRQVVARVRRRRLVAGAMPDPSSDPHAPDIWDIPNRRGQGVSERRPLGGRKIWPEFYQNEVYNHTRPRVSLRSSIQLARARGEASDVQQVPPTTNPRS